MKTSLTEIIKVPRVLIGLLCFVFIAADSFLHFGFVPVIHHLKKPMIFLSTEWYWILNLSLATAGGVLMSLKRPAIGALSGLITGILLQAAFTLYLFWRVEVDIIEILIPALIPVIAGIKIHEYLIKRYNNRQITQYREEL